MQIHYFHNGGFVLHRVAIGSCRYSAWYDASGRMLDCEQTFPRTRSVPSRNINILQRLQDIGCRYVRTTAQ